MVFNCNFNLKFKTVSMIISWKEPLDGITDALYSKETSKLSLYSSCDTRLFSSIEIGPLILASLSEISKSLKSTLSIYRVTQCRDIFPAGTAGKYCEHGVMRYYSLAQQNLRYIADFVAILGIIARNMPMWQRDRNMAEKFVALMTFVTILNMKLEQ